jgi:hypothetical protein
MRGWGVRKRGKKCVCMYRQAVAERRVSIEYHERFMQKILRFNRNITRYIYFDEFVNAALVKGERERERNSTAAVMMKKKECG